MEPRKIQDAAIELKNEAGERADLYVSYNLYGLPCEISIYPNGISSRVEGLNVRVSAETWDEALKLAREKWAEKKTAFRADTIRRIALAIIKITAEKGECKDADLRLANFRDSEISELGAEACADADAIANNGPFQISYGENAANAA